MCIRDSHQSFQFFDFNYSWKQKMKLTFGKVIVFKTQIQLTNFGLTQRKRKIRNDLSNKVLIIFQIKGLKILRKSPSSLFLNLNIARIHQQNKFFELRTLCYLFSNIKVHILGDMWTLPTNKQTLKFLQIRKLFKNVNQFIITHIRIGHPYL